MVKKIRRNCFAERLKALRSDAGLNQVALAQLLGIAQPAVARYESGVREPDLDDLMTIAEKLNTTPNELLGFETSAPVPTVRAGDNSAVNVAIGNNIKQTIAPPPPQSTSPSTSPSTSTARKRKAKG